jgi:3-methylfumaryl-CoA hydratase
MTDQDHVLTEKDLAQWLEKTQHQNDTLTISPATAMAATLDRQLLQFSNGDSLPNLWHWLYFLKPNRLSQLAADGHPEKGDFLPPISLPRRMWASSRLRFHQPLSLGQAASKKSTIKNIQFKQGRSGKLAFVCVAHEISNARGLAITEEQDLVYRGAALASAPAPSALNRFQSADFELTVTPDPVLLFRYSALTLNAHRIHYDRDYATAVEGYPALVVHGPLLATFMMELVAREMPDRAVLSFEFRAVQPVFDGPAILICGRLPDEAGRCLLRVENAAGEVCMLGEVVLEN